MRRMRSSDLEQRRERWAWTVVAMGSAMVAGIAARKLLREAWEKGWGSAPPRNPASSRTDWRQALAWSMASGLASGLSRLLAMRFAAAGWRRVRGDSPPGL